MSPLARSYHARCVLAFGLAASAASAASEDVPGWNAKRAELFSKVCMGSAPGFSGMEKTARSLGFRTINGNLMHEPEVAVSLQNTDTGCACYMTMGAYDPTALVQAIFQRLVNDYPDAWRPESESGPVNDTRFEREGEMVRLVLTPAKLDGNDWIAGRVYSSNRCPA